MAAPADGADPRAWGLERRQGRLHLDGQDLTALAELHGTPLHVASAARLRARAAEFQAAFARYPAPVSVHYSYKTNSVAGLLQVLHGCGLGAEVVGLHELALSRRLGLGPERIVLNGPNKSDAELNAAVRQRLRLVVVDGREELERLGALTRGAGAPQDVALRVCPDLVPRGLNSSAVTGSRRSPFGFEPGRELREAVACALAEPGLRLRGVMAHVGSGIHDLRAFRRQAELLLDAQAEVARAGGAPDLLDLGGGLGTHLSRELSTFQMLASLGLGRATRPPRPAPADLFERYGRVVGEAVQAGCRRRGLALPELVLEPGRALVSDAQVLLLAVGAVRDRPRLERLALTDGGAMTVSLTLLSEHHAVLLANREAGPDGVATSVFGRLPSPMDVVARHLPLPRLVRGDLLAVMDAGAYFTSTSTNFGGPRPPVVLIDGERARLVRRRETEEDLARVELALGER